jgi:DNA repair exonuclease SbcCD ATPase subunit/DNA repair exonuclease SbcCD nuclease subunit
MKIAHIADTHIKNLKFHDEYREVFNKMYDILRSESVDYIVHCGDIAHTKTQISPEFVEMAGDFFKNLASIAPTYIILGNHDGNLRNDSRQDAITPIVKALNLQNLYLLKDAGEISVNEQLSFNVMSVFDEKNWVKPSNPNKINVALFHGSVAGVQTDIGYVMEHGDYSVDIFAGHDFAMLGDIHKTNQVLDREGRVRYPGSTVQQNFGETDDKGFLIWDIEGKDKFSCKHYAIPNPRPFFTVILDENGQVPEVSVKNGARIRIVADKSVSLDKIKKATEVVKSKYSPESVTFVNKATASASDHELVSNVVTHSENLRDLSVQEKLIRNYLKDFKAEDVVLDKVVALNKKFSSYLEENEEVLRNVNWKLKTLEWDNLFNYGESNKINFENLEGIVGIFGKNYSGKSSVVDSLLYTIYNTTSKNNRKNINVINQNRDKGAGKVEVEIDDELYTIKRTSEKYTKKLKGVTTTEAKTDVEFTTSGESLNGLARNDTDKNIRRFFGTIDDFFLTSMASQFGYLSFIGEGSTKRKEILAKFLDLENFEKKYKLAKEESSEVKSLLKKLEGNNYDRDIATAELEVVAADNLVKQKSDEAESIKLSIDSLNEKLCTLNKAINSVPAEIIDIGATIDAAEKLKASVKSLKLENDSLLIENTKLELVIAKANELLGMIDVSEITSGDAEMEELNKKIIPLEKEISALSAQLSGAKHKLELLESVPCGDTFPSCKFIKDAFGSKKLYPELKDKVEQKTLDLSNLNERYDELDKKVTDLSNKQAKITQKKIESEKQFSLNQLKIEKNNVTIEKTSKQVEEYEQKIKNYNDNREAIENCQLLFNNREICRFQLSSSTKDLKRCEAEIIEAHRKNGSATERVEILKKQKTDLENLRKEYAAYDLFQACMHPSGISYEIIKQKLPEINAEIAKILTNIVEFGVYLENDDDKLDIFIKHPKYDARPLEMGSGAEKTIASTAIRLALLSVTTLPKGDIFILDEPGTALDEENMDGFVRILELIKTYFKTVILISHLDSLKDCVDMQISIEKINGYAHIDQ